MIIVDSRAIFSPQNRYIFSMTLEDIKHIISQGEGYTIEFKDAVGGTPSSFYESAVSMSNTDGGVIGLLSTCSLSS